MRPFTRRLVASAAGVLAIGGLSVFAFAGPASAGTGVGASGNEVPGAAAPQAPYTAGTPFSSGQGIDVAIPPNTVLTPGAPIYILECAAPNGVLPTDDSTCDGDTVQGPSETVGSDGSIDLINDTGIPYTIYSIPNLLAFGEGPTHKPVCGVGAANECVLYIGQAQGDFTQPHFFSQPFQVASNADNGGENPGDGTPEAPLAIGLPLLGGAVVGGSVLMRRRRLGKAAKGA